MVIKVFTDFTKRKNSTRQPAGGQDINCVLKEDTSILRPVFILNTPVANYTYVQAFSYFLSAKTPNSTFAGRHRKGIVREDTAMAYQNPSQALLRCQIYLTSIYHEQL